MTNLHLLGVYLLGCLIIAVCLHVSLLVNQMKNDRKTSDDDDYIAAIVFWPVILFGIGPLILIFYCGAYIGKIYSYFIKKLAIKIVGKAVVLTSPDPEIRKLAE